MVTYTQCTLKSGRVFHHAWIPTKFAVKKKLIQIKDDKGFWGRLWEVVSTGSVLDAQYVENHSRDYRIQRQVSDI